MLRIIRGKISISNIFSTDTLACVLGQAYAALTIAHYTNLLVPNGTDTATEYRIKMEREGKIWELQGTQD